MRVLSVLMPIFAMIGCMSYPKEDMIIERNLSLLQQQQSVLYEHAERLEFLSSSQSDVLVQIAEIQRQLASVSDQLGQLSPVQTPVATIEQRSELVSDAAATRSSAESDSWLSRDEKAVLGRVEYIWLDDADHYFKARLDTGSRSSSIHATDVQEFERDGEGWVSFVVAYKDFAIELEAPVVRHVRIRQASSSGSERRPVVRLKVRLGELDEETEFALSDRSDMIYPVLIGRSFLQDIAVVDVAKKFTRPRNREASMQIGAQ